jgi:hypothetical protein
MAGSAKETRWTAMKALTYGNHGPVYWRQGNKKYETRSWPTNYRGPDRNPAAIKDPCKLPLLGKEELKDIQKACWSESWL